MLLNGEELTTWSSLDISVFVEGIVVSREDGEVEVSGIGPVELDVHVLRDGSEGVGVHDLAIGIVVFGSVGGVAWG